MPKRDGLHTANSFLPEVKDTMRHTYRLSGVNIAAGDDLVHRIKNKVRSTFSKDVLGGVGLFGAFYDARFRGYKHPILVSSVDGVGTKLKIAFMMDRHDSIGEDLVNHCVNDIAVCGARPLFFMDYFATGSLKPSVAEQVIEGFIRACEENHCALIGGETAEMPGFYSKDEYDIAGTIVGVVEKNKIFDGRKIRAGDVLMALPSTGLHTNGYSLARKVIFERYEVDDYIDELGSRLGDVLLAVHRSYLKPIRAIADMPGVHGFSHITGGGIVGNTSRLLQRGLSLQVDWHAWERPAIFHLIQKAGHVPEHDMRRTFNLGVGLVIVASKKDADSIVQKLRKRGERPFVMGEVVKS
jgi:phosphoribosylformylglycinamidine cyclo-ligase